MLTDYSINQHLRAAWIKQNNHLCARALSYTDNESIMPCAKKWSDLKSGYARLIKSLLIDIIESESTIAIYIADVVFIIWIVREGRKFTTS